MLFLNIFLNNLIMVVLFFIINYLFFIELYEGMVLKFKVL